MGQNAPWLGRAASTLAATVAALAAGILGLAAPVEAARLTSSVFLLVTVATLALALGSLGAGWLFVRIGGRRSGASTIRAAMLVFAELAILIWFFLLRPSPYRALPYPPDDSVGFWHLSTGSRIAYERSAARVPRRRAPVIWLHGGPGLPLGIPGHAGASGERILDRLSADGFDVYYVDQIGSGRSARLEDPRQYTVDRHVADLEAIRTELRASKLILIGLSWGSTLAAAYLTEFPGRVARVVFESPGPVWWPAYEDPIDPAARIPSRGSAERAEHNAGAERPEHGAGAERPGRGKLSERLARPRFLLAELLARRNPIVLHALVDEEEIDGYLSAVAQHGPSPFCGDPGRFDLPTVGVGALAAIFTSADARSRPDNRAALARTPVPALVLRGSCDFVRREVAEEIVELLPDATLVEIEGAGHFMQFEQPDRYLVVLRSFLAAAPAESP